MSNRSIDFFENQFVRQAGERSYALNPFEQRVLPYLHGDVLDLGCGLGNLALAAAQQGCRVVAVDGAPASVIDLGRRAAESGLAVRAETLDLAARWPAGDYDAVVAIGLLMFFPPAIARQRLAWIRQAVRPGGCAAINVLVDGTSFLDMFEPDHYTLFGEGELIGCFAGWDIQVAEIAAFPAPGETLKRFSTVVARRPGHTA
jgi:tellurite methyltransferase